MEIAWCWLCAGQMFLLKVVAIEAGYVGIKHIFCVSAFGINYIIHVFRTVYFRLAESLGG